MRNWILLPIAFAILLSSGHFDAHGQSYPSEPVRLIVPYAPNSFDDKVARVLAPFVQAEIGQTVTVENRPGERGNIGALHVSESRPDGYSILFFSSSFLVNPIVYSNPPFDIKKDFKIVSIVARRQFMILSGPSLKVKDMKELVSVARERTAGSAVELNFGAASIAADDLHIASALFWEAADIKVNFIPERTGKTLLFLGNADFVMLPLSAASEVASANSEVNRLAVTGPVRAPSLPDLPTVNESGIAFKFTAPFGLAVPAATPKQVVDQLSGAMERIMASNEVKSQLGALDLDAHYVSSDQVDSEVAAEIQRLTEAAKRNNIKYE